MYRAFIVNPAAGSGYAPQVMARLEERLRETKMEYRIFLTERPGHGTELAAALAADGDVCAVAAVGGDGTAEEVAAGLCGTGKPMGIIPAGTGNDFIKSVGIPGDPEAALSLFLTGEPRDTDTGRVNGDFFLNECGTGFDVTVLDFAEAEKGKHRGLTPYLLGLLKAIAHYRSVSLKITVGQEPVREGKFLVCAVANGKYIGGGIPICPPADPADGMLDLVLIRDVPRWKIPFYLPGLMMSRALRFRITGHQLVSQVEIEGENLRINIDGGIRPMNRAAFSLRPASLRLIRPAPERREQHGRHQ